MVVVESGLEAHAVEAIVHPLDLDAHQVVSLGHLPQRLLDILFVAEVQVAVGRPHAVVLYVHNLRELEFLHLRGVGAPRGVGEVEFHAENLVVEKARFLSAIDGLGLADEEFDGCQTASVAVGDLPAFLDAAGDVSVSFLRDEIGGDVVLVSADEAVDFPLGSGSGRGEEEEERQQGGAQGGLSFHLNLIYLILNERSTIYFLFFLII